MSDKVVDINSRKPHVTGPAVCVGCKYKWEAVVPAGVFELECPECGLMKGVFYVCVFPDPYLTCGCGNMFFGVGKDGVYCSNCGLQQVIPE